MAERTWRSFGWQQIRFVAPADWYPDKVGIDRAEGELYLSDSELSRLQIKWLDTSRQKSVDPKATLDRWLAQLERQAKKQKLVFEVDRDTRLVSRGKRQVSSLECFRWQADVESFGLIWYSPDAQRVTLAQVNGRPGETGLKTLAKQVLGSLDDAPAGDLDLWTAYSLECRVPPEFRLTGCVAETGHYELTFERGKDKLAIGRWGTASIVLKRHGNLGDWASTIRFRSWASYRLSRDEADDGGPAQVAFRGFKRGPVERFRARAYNFFGAAYSVGLEASCRHDPEADCLILVEHQHDARSAPLALTLAGHVPGTPSSVPAPRA